MKDNKGFTLIEIIAVIAILGVIGTVFIVSLEKTLNKTQESDCSNFVSSIETAACTYASIHCQDREETCSPISLNTLIKEGLITDEVDACTKKAINEDETVSITWNADGEKVCNYNGVREYER